MVLMEGNCMESRGSWRHDLHVDSRIEVLRFKTCLLYTNAVDYTLVMVVVIDLTVIVVVVVLNFVVRFL